MNFLTHFFVMNGRIQAQRARGKLGLELKELMEKQKVDAFVGSAIDWEWICAGNLVGMPVIVIPTGLKDVADPPANGTKRRTTTTIGIYAPPYHDTTVIYPCFTNNFTSNSLSTVLSTSFRLILHLQLLHGNLLGPL